MGVKPLPGAMSANCSGAVAPQEYNGSVTFTEGDTDQTVLQDLLVRPAGTRAMNSEVAVQNTSCHPVTLEVSYLDGVDCGAPCGNTEDAAVVVSTVTLPGMHEWEAPDPSVVTGIRVAMVADIPVDPADDAAEGPETVTVMACGASTADCKSCLKYVPTP